MNYIKEFLDFVDGRTVIRRAALLIVIWLTVRSFFWAAHFAEVSPRPGTDIAAIIAAVTIPLSALQSFVFKWYSESRNYDDTSGGK